MRSLYISDLHLSDERPEANERFFAFMEGEAARSGELYVLGDLFEYWVGDDDLDDPFNAVIAGFFRRFTAGGGKLFVLHGNRDFLVGERFSAATGARLLDDPALAGDTLLMHGDTLCTDDLAYQAVRKQVRTPEWQAQILAMPLEARRVLAAKAREDSKAHTGSTMESIMDVNADAVAETMRKAGVTRLIHGHTHRPAVHAFELDGQPAKRIVLGDWYEHGSVLRVDGDGVELRGLATG